MNTRAGVDISAWKQRQDELRDRVSIRPIPRRVRLIAGVDCAFSADKRHVLAAAVLWDRRSGAVLEQAVAMRSCPAPYVPGYLSFREGPAVHAALDALDARPDAVLFDGQGLAHPRRCGLATHLAVERDVIGVGAAKSRLMGEHGPLPARRGAWVPLLDDGETVGAVLRTRQGVRPLFISVGHRADLPSAIELVLSCCTRYRLPEPTRLADRAVAAFKRESATPCAGADQPARVRATPSPG